MRKSSPHRHPLFSAFDRTRRDLLGHLRQLRQVRGRRRWILLGSIGAVFTTAHAANQIWDGGGANALWSNIVNWVGDSAAPGDNVSTDNPDVATFNAAIANNNGISTNPIVSDANRNIGGINFDTAAGSYFIGALGGNALKVSSGGTIQVLSTLTATNAVFTINGPLQIQGANGTYTLANNSANGSGAGAGTLTFNGGISGAAAGATVLTLAGSNTNANTINGAIANGAATTLGVTKNGAGTWVLTGANTYTGPTTINQGTLNANSSAALGDGSATNTLIFNGGILQAGANFSSPSSRGVTLNSTGTVDTNSFNVSIGGVVTGAGGLTKSGAGVLTLSGTNNYTGVTTISAGTLAVATIGDGGVAGNLGAASSAFGNLVFNGGTLRYTGATASTDRGFTINADATIEVSSAASNLTLTGAVSNPSLGFDFYKTGAGTLTLSGTLSLPVGTDVFVNAGTLVLDYTASNTGKITDTETLTLGNGTLQLDRATGATGSHLEIINDTNLAGAGSITRGAGSTAVLQMNGIGRTTNSVTNASMAGGTVNFGAENIATTDNTNSNGILGPWATVAGTDWAMNSGSTTAGGATSGTTGVADGFIRAYTGYTDVSRLNSSAQVIANNSAANVRIIEGTGTAFNLTLGASTTTINTLNQSAAGGSSAATIDASGKTLRVGGILVGSGAGALTIGTAAGSGTLTTPTAGGELIVQNFSANTLTINSVLADNTSATRLTVAGTGTTVLAGVNTYTGKTIVSSGKLSLSAETGLGNNPSSYTADQLTLNGGTLLAPTGFAIDDSNRGISLGTAGGTFEVTTGTLSIGFFGASTNIISGSGSLTKNGAGSLQILSTNNYSGPTVLNQGTLNAIYSAALGDGSATNALVFNGGALQAAGDIASPSTRGVTMASTGQVNTSVFLVSLAGAITGPGGLTKTGSGVLSLSGTNDYTGVTTISGGTLSVATIGDGGVSGNLGAAGSAAANLVFGGGSLRYTGATASSNRGFTISADATIEVSSAASNLTLTGAVAGNGDLLKTGAGTLTLSGTLSLPVGTDVFVNAGTLVLDYTTSNTGKITDTETLTLGSATLQLDRATGATGSHLEIINDTNLAGAGSITRGAGSTAVLQMNGIGRTSNSVNGSSMFGGTVNFGAQNIATTDNTNSNGILGGWATVAGTDWAINSGSTTAGGATAGTTGVADGYIRAYTGYTDVTRLNSSAQVIADGSTTNVRIIEGTGSSFFLTLGATTTTINTLNQSASGGSSAATIDASGKTLRVGGILVGSGAGALTIGTAAGSGTLSTPTAGGELIVQNFSTNGLTINSILADNTSATRLTQTGTGTTVLAGVNTYTGKTVVTGGKLSISDETGLGGNPSSFTADQLTLNGGTLLTTASFSLDDSNRGITLGVAGGTVEVATGTFTLGSANVLAGSAGGRLTKTGAGTMAIFVANTYTGGTFVSAGTLQINGTTLGSSPTVDIASGATLEYNDSTGTVTQGGLILTGAGTLRKTGASTLVFGVGSGADINWNFGAGALIDVQAGTLVGGSSVKDNWSNNLASLNIAAGALFSGVEAAVQVDALTGAGTYQGGYLGNRFLTIGVNNGSGNFSGVLQDDPSGGFRQLSLVKQGSGTENLSGPSTYSGMTNVNAGTLKAGIASVANVSGAFGDNSAVSIAPGAILDITGFNTQIGSLTGAGSVTLGAATLSIGGDNTSPAAYAGVISGSGGSISKIGTGTLTLSGTNTYTGVTTFNGGFTDFAPTLVVGSNLALGTTAGGTVVNGTPLTTSSLGTKLQLSAGVTVTGETLTFNVDLGQRAVLYFNGAGSAAWNGDISIAGSGGFVNGNNIGVAIDSDSSSSTLTIGASSANTITSTNPYGLTLRGSGGQGIMKSTLALGTSRLSKFDSGTWTLSGPNTYTGPTNIGAGTLKAGIASVANVSGAFGNNSAVSLANASGAVLDITGFNTQIGSLTGGGASGGNVTLGSATLTLGGDNTSPAAYAGIISGIGGKITKIGTGTETFSGNNTYNGATTVSGGTLLVTGSISGSATTVSNAGSTLGGTGTVGAVTVNSGAILEGGSGAAASGTLSSAGAISLNDSSVIELSLGTGGIHSSLARTGSGTWSFDNDQAFTFNLFTPTGGGTVYDNIISGLRGDEAGLATINTWTINTPGVTGTFSYDGAGGVDLTVSSVPEPGSAALLLAGLPMLGMRRRRRGGK